MMIWVLGWSGRGEIVASGTHNEIIEEKIL
jgi:hypothetical protein